MKCGPRPPRRGLDHRRTRRGEGAAEGGAGGCCGPVRGRRRRGRSRRWPGWWPWRRSGRCPARFAVRRSTSNEPEGAVVVAVVLTTRVPLSVMTTCQVWPTTFWSTSNSTRCGRRPLALSFQVLDIEHCPLLRTSSPPLAESGDRPDGDEGEGGRRPCRRRRGRCGGSDGRGSWLAPGRGAGSVPAWCDTVVAAREEPPSGEWS